MYLLRYSSSRNGVFSVTALPLLVRPPPLAFSFVMDEISGDLHGNTPLLPKSDVEVERRSHYGAAVTTASFSVAPSGTGSDVLPGNTFNCSSERLWSISALWQRGYTSDDELNVMQEGHPLREYYESQNSLLESFADAARGNPHLSPADRHFLDTEFGMTMAEREHALLLESEDAGGVTAEERHSSRAIFVSNAANIVLLAAQLYAFIVSGSCSMLAVLLDATLDVTSGLVILATWYMKTQVTDTHKYPVGRSRLEPLGIILMACLMTAGTLTSVKEGSRQIFEVVTSGTAASGFNGMTVSVAIILSAALVTKGSLYLYCRDSSDQSVAALAMDHKNDVIASSFAIFAILITQHFPGAALMDPVGGILISFLIIRNWGELTLEHVDNLLSRTAPGSLISQLIFITLNHSPYILCVDTGTCEARHRARGWAPDELTG